MCFTVQLSRLFAVISRLTAHLLYHLLFSLSRTFLFYFFKFFSVVCFSNSDIISCLQFPVNTFFIFFSTLFNQFFVVCRKNPPHSEADLSYHYFFFASSTILHFFTYFFTCSLFYQTHNCFVVYQEGLVPLLIQSSPHPLLIALRN